MWVSPNHPNPPRPPGPPEDEGQELATVRRQDGHELRVRLKTFESHPYVLIQLWKRDADGTAWPVKGRSASIRMGEIGDVIEGLQGALAAAGELSRRAARAGQGVESPRDEGPRFVDRGKPQRPPWEPNAMPKPQEGGGEFSEFE